jgi:hypothetical protein
MCLTAKPTFECEGSAFHVPVGMVVGAATDIVAS